MGLRGHGILAQPSHVNHVDFEQTRPGTYCRHNSSILPRQMGAAIRQETVVGHDPTSSKCYRYALQLNAHAYNRPC